MFVSIENKIDRYKKFSMQNNQNPQTSSPRICVEINVAQGLHGVMLDT
jgi:hypothetical protein